MPKHVEDLRNMRDASLTAIIALPAAGAAANSPIIDLGTNSAGRAEDVEIVVELPATPALVDAKTITLTVQESDDGVTFAAQPDFPVQVATGGGGAGAAGLSHRTNLPLGLKR